MPENDPQSPHPAPRSHRTARTEAASLSQDHLSTFLEIHLNIFGHFLEVLGLLLLR